MADEEGGDARIPWLESRTQTAFKTMKAEKFKKGFNSDDNVRVITEFLDSPDVRVLLFSENLSASHGLPKKMGKNKILYFLKVGSGSVTKESIASDVICGEMSPEPLQHLEQVVQQVYLPLLSNPLNQEGWGEVASKEIIDKLHGFLANVSITLGSTRGMTCLPLPPQESGAGVAGAGSAGSSKDRIHLLEGAVITWTKQIKNVLKQDPESMLKQGLHPTPDVEIAFWKSKAENLNSIFEQLQGERIRKARNARNQPCFVPSALIRLSSLIRRSSSSSSSSRYAFFMTGVAVFGREQVDVLYALRKTVQGSFQRSPGSERQREVFEYAPRLV